MDTPTFTCFGASHIDRRAHALAEIAATTSNPVEVTESPGGVARNVAEVLALLGNEVALVSIMGRDRHGQVVASQLTEAGVDLSNMQRSDTEHTATYTALVEPDGHLYVGLADMAIYELLTPDSLEEAAAENDSSQAWFIDGNLPPDSITWLAARSPGLLGANPVSVPKARRLHPILEQLDVLVANREEAAALMPDASNTSESARMLGEAGVDVVAVTTHEEGAVLVAGGELTHLEALTADPKDATGAGDAFTAMMMHGLVQGLEPPTAAQMALGAAAITVETDASVASAVSEEAARLRAGLPKA